MPTPASASAVTPAWARASSPAATIRSTTASHPSWGWVSRWPRPRIRPEASTTPAAILVPPRSMPSARADAPSGAGAIATTLPTLGLEAGQLPLQPVDGLHRRRIHPVEVRQVEADIIPQIEQRSEEHTSELQSRENLV